MSVLLCSKILISIYLLKYIIWDFRKLYFYNIKSSLIKIDQKLVFVVKLYFALQFIIFI